MRLLRLCVLAATFISLLPGLGHAQPTGRCAFINTGLLPGYSEPERHCFNLAMTCPPGSRYGCFKVPLEFETGWVDKPGEPRLKRLGRPFGFIDPDGVHWDVPAGALTDGATIPLFQAFIGGPWTATYVKAATLHDFYIRRSTVNAAAVHRMFYWALLADGNSQLRAAEMYAAVAQFGPQRKNIDVAAVDAMWRNRKAVLDELTRLHKAMWEAHQENERKREAQAAIDRATLSKPLEARTRVYVIRDESTARAGFETFIDAAARDHVVDYDRDASLIASLREQLEIELLRPTGVRDNVFVLRFMNSGASVSRFAARSDADLKGALAADAEISERLDGAVIDAVTNRR